MTNPPKPWPYEWCEPVIVDEVLPLSGTVINAKWQAAQTKLSYNFSCEKELIAELNKRFAACLQSDLELEEKHYYDWLRFGQGSNWPDIPPNRLFGAYWVGDGCVG